MDPSQIKRQGSIVLNDIVEYYSSLDDLPPGHSVKPGHLSPLVSHHVPEDPESLETIRHDIKNTIIPGIVHWQSPNFYGWYPLSSSVPSILADMYMSMLNIAPFSWLCSPTAAELEPIVMDAMGRLIGLDKRFLSNPGQNNKGSGGGAIQGGASESALVVMIAAREKAIAHQLSTIALNLGEEEKEDAADSIRIKLVAYCSDQTHSSIEKAAKIVGCKIYIVPTIDGDFSLTKKGLTQAVGKDIARGRIPFFVCATFGTTNTASIDDIPGIADVCEQHRMWLHVDAAYAGAALVCPEFRPLAAGIDRVDSFMFNPYKWMLTSVSCSCMWVANSKDITSALSIHREYLPTASSSSGEAVRDNHNWKLQLGQPFRALKLWMVLRMHGAAFIRQHIRQKVELAQWLASRLQEDRRFELVAPVVFGLVVFRIAPAAVLPASAAAGYSADDATTDLATRIYKDGRVFLLPTRLYGRPAIRVAIGATMCTQKHVAFLLSVIQQLTSEIITQEE
ncbi:hypothetical protein GGI20_002140 [Coemansia sp. BCRC 34301]|nr:hypothetical protein GGI20_002140 [Coemansia sp. BCRC 34301]